MNASATLRRGLVATALTPLFANAFFPDHTVLHLDGILVLRGERDRTARVMVIPLDGPETMMDGVVGPFTLDLALDRVYLLSFECAGMVTKQIYFDTAVPDEVRSRELEFPFMVTLNAERKKGTYAYAGPVGVVYYKAELANFGFDTDYTLKPGSRMAENFDALTARNVVPTPAFVRAPRTTPEHLGWGVERHDTTGAHADNVRSEPRLVHRITYHHPAEVTIAKRTSPEALSPTPPVNTIVAASATTPAASPTINRSEHPMLEVPQHREEELIIERLRVITVVRLTERTGHVTEYRRVVDRNGSIVHFRDGLNIPASLYNEWAGP